jgi:hypothetical protein
MGQMDGISGTSPNYFPVTPSSASNVVTTPGPSGSSYTPDFTGAAPALNSGTYSAQSIAALQNTPASDPDNALGQLDLWDSQDTQNSAAAASHGYKPNAAAEQSFGAGENSVRSQLQTLEQLKAQSPDDQNAQSRLNQQEHNILYGSTDPQTGQHVQGEKDLFDARQQARSEPSQPDTFNAAAQNSLDQNTAASQADPTNGAAQGLALIGQSHKKEVAAENNGYVPDTGEEKQFGKDEDQALRVLQDYEAQKKQAGGDQSQIANINTNEQSEVQSLQNTIAQHEAHFSQNP